MDEIAQDEIAEQLGVDRSMVSYHIKHCMRGAITRTAKRRDLRTTLSVAGWMRDYRDRIEGIVNEALANGDAKTAIDAMTLGVKTARLYGRVTRQLEGPEQINIMLSPEYVVLKQTIIEAVSDPKFTDARAAIGSALMKLAAPLDSDEVIDDS